MGKVCYVRVFDASISTYVRIMDMEENWIKVKDEKGAISLINGDMIKTIEIAAEKHQEKCK